MNIVVKSALAGAALVVAYACATPVEIADDVLPSDPSDFGDGGLPLAGTGGGAGATQGGTGGSGVPAGGAGIGGASAGTGMQASAGSGGLPVGVGGTGGGAGGATAQGGAGGVAGGAAGAAAGTGGAAAGGGGAGGTGATSTFDPAACDFEDVTGCETLTCLAACSTTDGGYCRTSCETLITCVSTNTACVISEADPLCAVRNGGTPNACTEQAQAAGGVNTTQPTQPAFVARQFVECICSVPRP